MIALWNARYRTTLLRVLAVASGVVAVSSAHAARYWPNTPLTQWEIVLNNGVVYIVSPQMATHCSYTRGQIDVGASAYNRALYAFALSAKARGKALRYVVDDSTSTCVIDALSESEPLPFTP